MADVDRQLGFTANAKQLIDTRQQVSAFPTHVAGVDPVVGRDDFGQLDHRKWRAYAREHADATLDADALALRKSAGLGGVVDEEDEDE